MPNTAQMLENSILNLCNQFLPVYRDWSVDIVRKPRSTEDIKDSVLLAQSQYFLSIFNKLQSGFSDNIKGRIGYALNNPSSIGLPSTMTIDYLEDHGISAGTIFALLYFAVEGTAARDQSLIDTMNRLDNKQIQLMDSVWQDLIKAVKPVSKAEPKHNEAAYNRAQNQEQAYKKEEDPFAAKVKEAFSKINQESARTVFPGGVAQANRVIKSIAQICAVDWDNCTIDKLSKLLEIYLFVDLRKSVQGLMDQRIMNDMKQHFRAIVKNNEMASGIIGFWTLHKSNNLFDITLDSDNKVWEQTTESLRLEIDIIKKNTLKASKVIPDNDLGRIATKPLYSSGKDTTVEYLSHLVTSNGRKLTCKHNGDTSAVGILGKVDIYAMSTLDGNHYGLLYINQHSESVPDFAPAGYKYIIDPSNYEEPKMEQQTTAAETPSIQFCRKCGNKLHPGSVYCNKCGTKI